MAAATANGATTYATTTPAEIRLTDDKGVTMIEIGATVELLSGLNKGHIGTLTDVLTHPEGGFLIYIITIPGGTRRSRTTRTARCLNIRPA